MSHKIYDRFLCVIWVFVCVRLAGSIEHDHASKFAWLAEDDTEDIPFCCCQCSPTLRARFSFECVFVGCMRMRPSEIWYASMEIKTRDKTLTTMHNNHLIWNRVDVAHTNKQFGERSNCMYRIETGYGCEYITLSLNNTYIINPARNQRYAFQWRRPTVWEQR